LFLLIFQRYATSVFVFLAIGLQKADLRFFKQLLSLRIFKNPPKFITPFYIFIFLEMPFLVLSYGLTYLLLRKTVSKKTHLVAMALSSIVILSFGLYSFIKPKEVSGYKMPKVFYISDGLRRFKCQLIPDETVFNWTYPEDGQTNVSVHSPIVINVKKGIRLVSGCSVYYEDSQYADSSGILGGVGEMNLPIVPDGRGGITELQFLQRASLEEIKLFVSHGRWREGSTIKVVCSYVKSQCLGEQEFTFTTEVEEKH
jgi:uncharacterized protein YhhL (DUF1145 family)